MKNILMKFSNQVLSKGQLKAIRGGYGGCEPMNTYTCSILLKGSNVPVVGSGCGTDAHDAETRCKNNHLAIGWEEDEVMCSCE